MVFMVLTDILGSGAWAVLGSVVTLAGQRLQRRVRRHDAALLQNWDALNAERIGLLTAIRAWRQHSNPEYAYDVRAELKDWSRWGSLNLEPAGRRAYDHCRRAVSVALRRADAQQRKNEARRRAGKGVIERAPRLVSHPRVRWHLWRAQSLLDGIKPPDPQMAPTRPQPQVQ